MNDYTFIQTKQISLVVEQDGIYIMVDPLWKSLLITDILITWHLNENEKNLTQQGIYPNLEKTLLLQIGDNNNRFEIVNLDVVNLKSFHHNFTGGFRFWKGGRLELFKQFPGKLTCVVGYNLLPGPDYSIWKIGG